MDKISAETIINLSKAGYSADEINKIVDALKPSDQDETKSDDLHDENKGDDLHDKDEKSPEEDQDDEPEKDTAEVEKLKKEIKDLQEKNRRQAQSNSEENKAKEAYDDLVKKISSI